jgi:hypothetical protein
MVPNFIKSAFVKSYLGKLSNSNDTKATLIGVIAAGLLASGLDWGKIFEKDPQEIGKLVGSITIALLGYWTNKKDKIKEEVKQ